MKPLAELFDKFVANVYPAMLDDISKQLGVSKKSLQAIRIGFNPGRQSWIFPERDAKGNIIGLIQRLPDNKKQMIKNSKRGLTYAIEQNKGTDQYTPGKHNWTRVSEKISCPICGKHDGCLVPAGNPPNPQAVVCVHISKGSTKQLELGYLHILKPSGKIVCHKRNLLLDIGKPVIVVEGQTDVAAAMDLGFSSVGRPSAQGKMNLLVDLLKGQEIIIVGENDEGAGKQGMEAAFFSLRDVCRSVIKVLPPEGIKDLREWKCNKETFLKWVKKTGNSGGNPNIFEDDIAHTIAKTWLDQKKTQDNLPTIRNYRGQFIEYEDGHYKNLDKDEFRGQIYKFLEGKTFPRTGANGEIVIVPYKPTRSKVTDIIDALSHWCTINEDPPLWLIKKDYPDPINLIAFRNGILDFNAYVEGKIKFYDPTPALFSFNILPYDFDEDLHSNLWENFYKDVLNNDKEKIRLLAQWFGYSLVPDMSHEKMMLFTGRPRSGKGTIINTLTAVLGDSQCCSTSFQNLCTEFGYQPLMGKLAVVLSDAKMPKQKEAEAALEKILQITGGDPVGIRRMYLTYLSQVYLKCRFTIAMNDLPNVPDHARALETRLNVLCFGNSYVGKEDTTLKFKLRKEAQDGKIVNFALQGLKDLRESGSFIMPESSKLIIEQLRELTTPVSAFVTECCELEPAQPHDEGKFFVLKEQIYEAWQKWCVERGRKPGLREQFGRWLLAACPSIVTDRIRIKGGKIPYVYQRIRLAKWVLTEYLEKPGG